MTHLIARTPSGHKFNYARLWAIKVVSIEWFEQSLERGMILDESLYDPVLPVQERGRNAWARKTTSTGSLGKRARENEAVPNRTRKLRRTASAKLSTHHDGIWTDIVGGGAQPERRTSVESDKSDPNSRVDSEGLSGPQIGAKRDDCSKINSIIGNRTGNQGLFEGKKFYVHGFEPRKANLSIVSANWKFSYPLTSSRILYCVSTCDHTTQKSCQIWFNSHRHQHQRALGLGTYSCPILLPIMTFPQPLTLHLNPP